jgi:electron transport complex protein RnfC
MAFYLKGVKLPHKKNTANSATATLPAVKSVTIPTSMHIGAPAKAIVKKGDNVFVGTLIAEAQGAVSSPVHSSVSGTVTAISEVLLANGNTCEGIVIESDGQNTIDPAITPPTFTTKEELTDALFKSGIVGLGGAGFPTSVKFKTENQIEELVINGAECEPYITSDNDTMLNKADLMEYAIKTLVEFYSIKKVIIGIEKNKPRAIASMKQMVKNLTNAEVKSLPSIYPQGGEKVLIYHTTGKVVKEGGLPIDVGCVVCNCSTIAEIGKFLKTGIPLVDRTLTVDGDAIENPQNVVAPIGTPIKDVFEFCGVKKEIKKVLYGGPMMGISVPDTDNVVLKNTNALLALSQKETFVPKTTACISCGACMNNCPFGINPVAILKSYKANDYLGMKKAGALLCMECGCCSYVCPAKIPNVQNNKLAKISLRNQPKEEVK